LYFLRDYFFYLYQVSLIPAVGILSGLVLLGHFARRISFARKYTPNEGTLWTLWVLVVVCLGIAVVGTYDPIGLVHICLQPLILLGVVYLVAIFPTLSRIVKGTVIFGLAVDFLAGVALHFHLQNAGPDTFLSILNNRGTQLHQLFKEQVGLGVEVNYQIQLFSGYTFLGENLELAGWMYPPVVVVLLGIGIYLALKPEK